MSAPRRVLVLGSGALKIGEAGEFDYSGSQALKALREAGIFTVLVNPNVATVQTSEGLSDKLYALPLDPEVVERVIEAEKVDAILLSFGGQTALNCGLALDARGALARNGVRVLGTPLEAIRNTEDRKLFNERLAEIGVQVARGEAASSIEDAVKVAARIGLPVILRGAFALGGRGSSIVDREEDLRPALKRIFGSGVAQVLVEEGLAGRKELEFEIVRDHADQCICVCTMENVDSLGIHTGDSIVVAPVQTLTNTEVQALRTIAFKTIRHLGIVGECNIQFALDPTRWDYRVIEVNARLSRSSALASKATGYPLAYIATKLCLGARLDELKNDVTGTTSAFFEPALDYVTCKVPRWDLQKFRGADARIGSEMKSVGEVMAIGRSFPEVLQKAFRMLDTGVSGVTPGGDDGRDLETTLRDASPSRMHAIVRALVEGLSVQRVSELAKVDRFFVEQIDEIAAVYRARGDWRERLHELKKLGFSDPQIGQLYGVPEADVRGERRARGIVPSLLQIDTLAAEYPARTSYTYMTYGAAHDDMVLPAEDVVLILGSGPYRIGSSVEFDWCCVAAARAARELGFKTVLLNCNPETVSTDYDSSDLLVFDEISVEAIDALIAKRPRDATGKVRVVVSMGGQLPNNLALPLARAGIEILGTRPEDLDRAEDRGKFSALCDALQIDQPRWTVATSEVELEGAVAGLGGYPVIVRPSYVLSGGAMTVVQHRAQLLEVLRRAAGVSPEHPIVISKFESNAREFEIDAVGQNGQLVIWSISEHIENAGVHSGDATLVLPPQRLYLETIRRARRIAELLCRELRITGPFNVQFLARHNEVKVIECNVRASRSFPFVSKVTGNDFAREAMRRMLGKDGRIENRALDLDHVGVKAPQFSFGRLAGADPYLGVEMASTGEVACLGEDLHEALLKAMWSVQIKPPRRGVLLSLGTPHDKYRFQDEARLLAGMKLPLFATSGTAAMLREDGVHCEVVARSSEEDGRTAREAMEMGLVDLVINIPRTFDENGRPDGYEIRRAAVDLGVPLITDIDLARAFVYAQARAGAQALTVRDWASYFGSSGHSDRRSARGGGT
ncbi:MAG TPA: carbamoyl-phosphate synthase (glutamine-hydrolyzing) large subunit [Polyangiaceae bacterium]